MAERQYPEPVVGVYIFNPENKLFLMQSPKWNGKWVIPGGHIEIGETMEEAAIREAKEETGLAIFDLQFINLVEMIYPPDFTRKKHFVGMQFKAHTNDTIVTLNEEATNYKWFTPRDALSIPLNTWTQKIISQYLL